MSYPLKHAYLLYTASRTASPPCPSPKILDKDPLSNKLLFGGFRRTSSGAPPKLAPAPPVHDASYLEVLNLTLSKAVSDALAQPAGPATPNELVGGKLPIPAGQGSILGLRIATVLQSSRPCDHLYKATLRSLHKPLTVLLNNLSAMVLPLISSPAFRQPPAPTIQTPNPNATQLHALAIANFAGELLASFDEMGLGLHKDLRADGLKSVREGLLSLIGRVIDPLITGIALDLITLMEALERPASVTIHRTNTKTGPVSHPSITALQGLIPIYTKALERYTKSLLSQHALARCLIAVLWRALVALSHRLYVPPTPISLPGSPKMISTLLKWQSTSSPSATPPSSRFTLKLPPSRPPSPPPATVVPTAAADAKALFQLMSRLPRPRAEDEYTKEACEVVEAVLGNLEALATLLEASENLLFSVNKSPEDILEDVRALTADLPVLIALPVLLRGRFSGDRPSVAGATVASLISVDEEEYRKRCLCGFGCAYTHGHVVDQKVLDALYERPNLSSADSILVGWLECHTEAPTS